MLVYEIFDAVREKPRRGFPMLIGPTQWGKTHCGYEYAAARKLPFVPINPQLETEEEFGGFPLKNADSDEVNYSMPPALTTMFKALKVKSKDPYVLFIDEMDKARNDVLSCLLTLTSPLERRLRHIKLHADVLIVGAMNEPMRALPEPLLARMLMIPYPYDFKEYIGTLPADSRESVKKLFPGGVSPAIKFPARPKSPASWLTLREWFDYKPFWENEGLQQLIIRGLFPEQMVAAVNEEIKTEKPVSNPVQWVKRASPQAVLKGLIKVLDNNTPEADRDILQAFLDRAQADPTSEICKLYETFASEKSPEPHACVKYNKKLKSGQWTGQIGQEVWETEFKKALKAK